MMEIDETPQCESENAVVVDKLTFAYSPLYEKDAPIVLDEASMKLPVRGVVPACRSTSADQCVCAHRKGLDVC